MSDIRIEGDGQFPMDVRLPVMDLQFASDGTAIITAQGDYHGQPAGVEIQIRRQMKPGIVDGDIDKTAFYDKGVIVRPLGDKTEHLATTFSEIYKTTVAPTEPLSQLDLTTIALDGNPFFIKTQHLNFKVFHDDEEKLRLYFEMFLHVDIRTGYLRFDEKDEDYRQKSFAALKQT
jgi:hypothetical protein